MPRNRFEQVDDIQGDAITLSLSKQDDKEEGVVIFPASASNGRFNEDRISQPVPSRDAFRAAVKLANDMKVAIVVMDPHAIWNAEWGDLYRDAEAG